jgi:hypothetical protein
VIAEAPGGVDVDHVGRMDLRQEPRLALEVLEGPVIRTELRPQELDRYGAHEVELRRQVDGPHPALAQEPLQAEATVDRLPD